MVNRKRTLLYRTNIEQNIPKLENLDNGELAINTNQKSPMLLFKNNKDEIEKVGAMSSTTGNSESHTMTQKSITDYVNTNIVGKKNGSNGGEIFNDYANNDARRGFSHAEGCNTTAYGSQSHAEGSSDDTNLKEKCDYYGFDYDHLTENQIKDIVEDCGGIGIAYGVSSHSEGGWTSAIGNYSHAEGNGTSAGGYASHAEGNHTVTTNKAEHAEGKYNISNPNTISSVGVGDTEELRKNAIEVMNDGKVYINGIGNYDGTNPTDSNDLQTQLVGKKASNGGEIFNDYGNNIANGVNSHAEGKCATTNGNNSHAEGTYTCAEGASSHAEGYNTIANGKTSHTEGWGTQNIYLKGDANATKYQLVKGLLKDIGKIEILIQKFKNSLKVEFYDRHASANIIDSVIENGVVYLILDKTLDPNNAIDDTGQPCNKSIYAQALGESSHTEGAGCNATGEASHAEGANTTAIQEGSHSEGVLTVGLGYASHAEGLNTCSHGSQSHAEGNGTIASGNSSHTEGQNTTANGIASHAEGGGTTASGDSSHAEGQNTTANGIASHAEGAGSFAQSIGSHAEGEFTNANGAYSHAEGVGSHAEGHGSHAEGGYATKPGTEMEMDTIGGFAIGDGSHAEGVITTANGMASHAEGIGTTADGNGSHAEGSGTTATSNYSHAEGCHTTADGLGSHAEGGSTNANENYSHAEGNGTTAAGIGSHAEGIATEAYGEGSHVEGDSATAAGYASHAEGNADASGDYSHAEGSGTTANGITSHAEGDNTKAFGLGSHTEGYKTQAKGNYSHSEGSNTKGSDMYCTFTSETYNLITPTKFIYDITKIINNKQQTAPLLEKGSLVQFKDINDNMSTVWTVKANQIMNYIGNEVEVLPQENQTLPQTQADIKEIIIVQLVGARGVNSHVEGSNSLAAGDNAHAQGIETGAYGDCSTSMGYGTIASNYGQAALGYLNTLEDVPSAKTFDKAKTIFSIGNGELGDCTSNSTNLKDREATRSDALKMLGNGTTWIAGIGGFNGTNPTKENSLQAQLVGRKTPEGGEVFNRFNNASGKYSHAEGYGTAATGDYSHAEGDNTTANGRGSHVEGISDAVGDYSHAEGSSGTEGDYSHAEGNSGTYGDYSHAEGGALAIAMNSHAEGNNTNAGAWKVIVPFDRYGKQYKIGDILTIPFFTDKSQVEEIGVSSHAEGESTQTMGSYSHAEGKNTIAWGNFCSHAEGFGTIAIGDFGSHAEGWSEEGMPKTFNGKELQDATDEDVEYEWHNNFQFTMAYGEASHAEGCECLASGEKSHAEGYGCLASGIESHAEGIVTEAIGSFSHTEGESTRADNYGQHSQGRYNTIDGNPSKYDYNATKTAFVIGNGTDDVHLSNAFEVKFNGEVYTDGNLLNPNADYAEMFEWKDSNTNDEDRVGYFVTLNGDKIVKAKSTDKYILGIVSAAPAVIGDNPNLWHGQYLNDEWGRPIYEDVEVEYTAKVNYTAEERKPLVEEEYNRLKAEAEPCPEGLTEKEKAKFLKEQERNLRHMAEMNTPTSYDVTKTRTDHVKKTNPEWDASKPYIDRTQRKEWDAIGLMGKLLVRQDGTLKAGGFCKPDDSGIATSTATGYYVMKIINEKQALIMFR